MRGLRQHKKQEMLRIAARDLAGLQTLEDTVRELTALADVSLESSTRFCREELDRQYGPVLVGGSRPNGFIVLGMGKLGGEESEPQLGC